MKRAEHEQPAAGSNSASSVLARGCDPLASLEAARAIPPRIGNPEYVPTWTDEDFIDQLRSRAWSVVFFAPGARRFAEAGRPLPGRTARTEGWTLDDYRELVREHQSQEIPIVEPLDEGETVALLEDALEKARRQGSRARPAATRQ